MRRQLFLALLLGLAFLIVPAVVSANPRAGDRITLPAGTALHLRLEQAVGSDISRVEEPVRAQITRPVVVRGVRAIPAGSVAIGNVVAVRRAGHLKERGMVAVRFTEIAPRGDDERYRIRTRTVRAVGPSLTKRDVEGIGIPAAGGAIIGGILGGGKGAGIGAAAGGGAGTARLLMTRGKNVRMNRGALVAVRLAAPVTIDVPRMSARR